MQMSTPTAAIALLRLLQLVSPALPIGTYSYSEGLETLVESEVITNSVQLEHWLTQELRYGAIRLDGAVVLRAYDAVTNDELTQLEQWNQWLSAVRETAELRQSSWQMGRSLAQLFGNLEPDRSAQLLTLQPCNYAIAFGYIAAHWQIEREMALLGYLQSWLTHWINAAVKLVPLGQTVGQQLLVQLSPVLRQAQQDIAVLSDADLVCCSWGGSLASMNHEVQYSRLFRS